MESMPEAAGKRKAGEDETKGDDVASQVVPTKKKKSMEASAGVHITDDALNSHDVLLGRGSHLVKYEGNINFRELVLERQPEYVANIRHHVKDHIAREVIATIEGRKGRFLRRVETQEEATQLGIDAADYKQVWIPAEEAIVLEKVKQAFRDRCKKNPTASPPTDTPTTSLTQLAEQSNSLAMAIGSNRTTTHASLGTYLPSNSALGVQYLLQSSSPAHLALRGAPAIAGNRFDRLSDSISLERHRLQELLLQQQQQQQQQQQLQQQMQQNSRQDPIGPLNQRQQQLLEQMLLLNRQQQQQQQPDSRLTLGSDIASGMGGGTLLFPSTDRMASSSGLPTTQSSGGASSSSHVLHSEDTLQHMRDEAISEIRSARLAQIDAALVADQQRRQREQQQLLLATSGGGGIPDFLARMAASTPDRQRNLENRLTGFSGALPSLTTNHLTLQEQLLLAQRDRAIAATSLASSPLLTRAWTAAPLGDVPPPADARTASSVRDNPPQQLPSDIKRETNHPS